jgi:poly-gamma-glutamate biosynthesis protein PgsC/CapC
MHIILTGIFVSLLLTEFTGYSPGGIVVAGYLSLFAGQPVWLVGTLAAALLTHAVISWLGNHLLLYGRRLFAFYLLTGILISQGGMLLSRSYTPWDSGFLVIGYLIPGLIARDFARQGIPLTLAITCLAVGITSLIALIGEGWLW